MTYTVTINSPDGQSETYRCGGVTGQDALIYAGKVVEANAAGADPKIVCNDQAGTESESAPPRRSLT